jgi:hypothetical protein
VEKYSHAVVDRGVSMKHAPIKIILAILAGPLAAWLISLFNFVLAPPNQGFSELLFLPLCLLGFPVCIVLMFQKKLLGWKLLIASFFSISVPVAIFLVAAPSYLPSGMSTCELVENNGLKVTYACTDSSSDDASYHREFTVEGLKGWPIMRITED